VAAPRQNENTDFSRKSPRAIRADMNAKPAPTARLISRSSSIPLRYEIFLRDS